MVAENVSDKKYKFYTVSSGVWLERWIEDDEGQSWYLSPTGDGYCAIEDMWGSRMCDMDNPSKVSFMLDSSIRVSLEEICTDDDLVILTGSQFLEIPTNAPGNYDWNEGTCMYGRHLIIKPSDPIRAYVEYENGKIKRITPLPSGDLVS